MCLRPPANRARGMPLLLLAPGACPAITQRGAGVLDRPAGAGAEPPSLQPPPCPSIIIIIFFYKWVGSGWTLVQHELVDASQTPFSEMTSHVPMLSSGPAVPTGPHPFVPASLGGAGWVEPRNRVLGGQQASVKCPGRSPRGLGAAICAQSLEPCLVGWGSVLCLS